MFLACPRLSPLRARVARAQVIQASAFIGSLGLLLGALLLLSFQVLAHAVALQSEVSGWGMARMLLMAGACLVAVYCLIRVLFGRVPEPEGVRLERDSAASLYRAIDGMARRAGGARIDCILITSEMNAAIVQRPRWGVVGPMRTYLQLGLPLVHSVSGRQLNAILAHECAHLVLQRNGHKAWGCHMRAWAFRVIERLAAALPVLPRAVHGQFNAFALTAARLSHLEEYEADRAAARIVGAPLLAQTLVEVSLRERFLSDDFMCRVMAQCASLRSPAIRPYREMAVGMAAGFRWPEADGGRLGVRNLDAWDEAQPGLHPPLSSRLAALGVRHVRASRQTGSAADKHLGHLLPELASTFDRAWWRDVKRFWRTHYRRSRRNDAARANPSGSAQKATRSASR